MAKRPLSVHLVELSLPEKGKRQFFTSSAPDLSRQLKEVSGLPSGVCDLLSQVAVTHRGRASLPEVASVKHVSLLTPEQPKKAQQKPTPKSNTEAQTDPNQSQERQTPALSSFDQE